MDSLGCVIASEEEIRPNRIIHSTLTYKYVSGHFFMFIEETSPYSYGNYGNYGNYVRKVEMGGT